MTGLSTTDTLSVQLKPEVHPVVRLDFLVRRTTYPCFAALYITHLWANGITPATWVYLILYSSVFPYVAYTIARKSAHPKQAELRNLLADSFAVGTFVPLLSFSPWPCLAGVFGVHAGNVSVGGWRHALRALVVMALGILAMGLATGFHVDATASWLTTAMSIVAILVYITVFSNHSHIQSSRVIRGIRQIAEQNQMIREKRALLMERTLELENLQRAADKANQAKSQFLANMSHELRTPLNAIIGYSEMLMEEVDALDAESARKDLERIRAAGKHLLGLINEVLDLSKIEAGRMEVSLEDTPAEPLLREVVATVQPLVAAKANALELDLAPNLGDLHVDVTKTRQILLNLLSNACKFTERGRIVLAARRSRDANGDWITVEVRDSGIGMTPEQMSRLFQPFTQADASTSRKYGGTGLGLAISKRFAELMGGTISARSEAGRGTTFTVALPAVESAHATGEGGRFAAPRGYISTSDLDTRGLAELARRRKHNAHRLVLVVDDDPAALEMERRLLEREGFKVVCASGGEAGLRAAREHLPDLILLDVLMPQHDGWSVLSALKADAALARIPVIMVSIAEQAQLGAALGAAAFLTKPVDRDRFVELVAHHAGAGGAAVATSGAAVLPAARREGTVAPG